MPPYTAYGVILQHQTTISGSPHPGFGDPCRRDRPSRRAATRPAPAPHRARRRARGPLHAHLRRPDRGRVWDACTNAERLHRWYVPVTGDLRPGAEPSPRSSIKALSSTPSLQVVSGGSRHYDDRAGRNSSLRRKRRALAEAPRSRVGPSPPYSRPRPLLLENISWHAIIFFHEHQGSAAHTGRRGLRQGDL